MNFMLYAMDIMFMVLLCVGMLAGILYLGRMVYRFFKPKK
jgi:hypothetical protein